MRKPQELKKFCDRPSQLKEAWFYDGKSPSFHIILPVIGQLNFALPKDFNLVKKVRRA